MQSITRFNIAIGQRYRVLLYFLKDVLEILDHSVTKGKKHDFMPSRFCFAHTIPDKMYTLTFTREI